MKANILFTGFEASSAFTTIFSLTLEKVILFRTAPKQKLQTYCNALSTPYAFSTPLLVHIIIVDTNIAVFETTIARRALSRGNFMGFSHGTSSLLFVALSYS